MARLACTSPFLLWCSNAPLPPLPGLGPGRHQYDSHVCLPLGLKGTYQGLTATVLKQGSNQAIRFFVMTSLRNWYRGLYLLGRLPQDPTSSHSGLGSSSSILLARTSWGPHIQRFWSMLLPSPEEPSPLPSYHFLIETLPPPRGQPQQAHEPTDHWSVWSCRWCSQCLWEHSSGCDQDTHAGEGGARKGVGVCDRG